MSARAAPARQRGLTPAEVARRLRVSPERVRNWIRKGLLRAVNTADTLCGRPRWVVTPESLAEFERARTTTTTTPTPRPVRRRRVVAEIDYYPD